MNNVNVNAKYARMVSLLVCYKELVDDYALSIESLVELCNTNSIQYANNSAEFPRIDTILEAVSSVKSDFEKLASVSDDDKTLDDFLLGILTKYSLSSNDDFIQKFQQLEANASYSEQIATVINTMYPGTVTNSKDLVTAVTNLIAQITSYTQYQKQSETLFTSASALANENAFLKMENERLKQQLNVALSAHTTV